MKNFFKKKEKQTLKTKPKKTKVRTVGTRKKTVAFLWILLIGSLAFAIYKNFTAIDQHTIHVREIVENHMRDTTAIESFTKIFVKDYYTWENESEALEERTEKVTDYLIEELQALNADMVREDIPTSSTVQGINIWSLTEEKENTFSVVYSVQQKITEEKASTLISSTYRIVLYQDEQGNLVITQNPTIWNKPEKSSFAPEQVESDGTVESEIAEEVTLFLETFFASYPTATEQELAYYVKNNTLPAIEKDYTFSELVNPIYQEKDNQIKAWVTVKYLDETTKATQLSQYELTLEKDTNWMIIK